MALSKKAIFRVVFCLVPTFEGATKRAFKFMLNGLREVEHECRRLNVPFHCIQHAEPAKAISQFAIDHQADSVVADFSPLRVPLNWTLDCANELSNRDQPIALYQVDAHNIVPCWIASDKLEYAARTIRTKITNKLPTYLVEFPNIEEIIKSCQKQFDRPWELPEETNWDSLCQNLSVTSPPFEDACNIVPGTKAGMHVLEQFCKVGLKKYPQRNDPNANALSQLSPYFHFGQVAPQRAALNVKKVGGVGSTEFLEEAIIRRELADNFCFYNKNYDNLAGAYSWANDTLKTHQNDTREWLYTEEELEKGATHDSLWNAAQWQMVKYGKMHGFLRMYWAKKILEWTESPAQALEISINQNNRWEIDGRDPNGYVGCMWSICGVHDQGWGERPIFGKIRYMNYEGCKRKFDVNTFISKYRSPFDQQAVKQGVERAAQRYNKKSQPTLHKYTTKP